MDNNEHEKENERRNSNTEYQPTKCRITKPPPPKPATNPLQFIKVAPCPLFQKAQEQIKKVEEIKKERKEIRDETEDWQQNLDNWKSSRRKRQEHIIERVVEVKKLTEQEELEKARRKSKTFSEMIEERSRGRHKFTIPIYDDDSNDLSDYGIGSSSSKTNSIKDVDTDDSSSILDEKDHHFDSHNNKDNSSTSNQSQSEDETNFSTGKEHMRKNVNNNSLTKTYTSSNINNVNTKPKISSKPRASFDSKSFTETSPKESTEQYTYEGAIQDYRSRIQSKIKVDESIFTKNQTPSKSKEFSEAQTVLPKGEISKRKGLFEMDKPTEIKYFESNSFRDLTDDFANAKSIRDRLKSLEKSTDQSLKNIDKSDIQVSVKQRLQNFDKKSDSENNNINRTHPNKISNYLLHQSSSTQSFFNKKSSIWTSENSDRCSSPEAEIYMNKLNTFNRDLDDLMNRNSSKSVDENTSEYCSNSDYAPTTSSVELTGVSSDREDSGIHTADISCSPSQSDERLDKRNEVEYILSETEPNDYGFNNNTVSNKEVIEDHIKDHQKSEATTATKIDMIAFTQEFLDSLIKDATENISACKEEQLKEQKRLNMDEEKAIVPENVSPISTTRVEPVVYENVEVKLYTSSPSVSVEIFPNNFIADTDFSVKLEPPKEKPPPPPKLDDEVTPPQPIKRLNSTKRIKKEIHIKRNSFLGLEEPNVNLIDPDSMIEKPPDLNSFLQKESNIEKNFCKKIQEENRGGLLKVESQDSGLDIDRGRLSSDTWCSSIGDSSTPSHERQDSEHTNSITSEEDEITKKEREIIEMVEKEEKSRDSIEYSSHNDAKSNFVSSKKEISNFDPALDCKQFTSQYFPQSTSDFLKDQDSEVLKVEYELRQLEREELERQRENLLFRESRAKARLQNNRHSLENICDEIHPYYANIVDYRKSMPELQHVPVEYGKPFADMSAAYSSRSRPEGELQYRKSMPDIQHAYQNSNLEQKTSIDSANLRRMDHRKSMPELQHHSAFKSSPINKQPIMPGKPIRSVKEPSFSTANNNLQNPKIKPRQLSKHSLQALSAVPRSRHVPNDNWIQPKTNPEVKSYNQHWVFQEAELRRISDQQKNVASSRNWQQPRHEKHLPDSIIQSLTQRVQNKTNNLTDRNLPIRRPEGSPSKDYNQHSYLGNPTQTVGHALPTVPFPPPVPVDESSQDRILSVSGKKKCSYCGNELGRGAAMIIESLHLFYHMECFKCCVCHIQLGDGRMGTDVRVRNQKLHCHNCYSSEDGVKFSCV